MTSLTPSVSLVFSRTTLLSGGLDDCFDIDDDSCEGGIALILAYVRQFSDGIDEGNLVINRLDYQSVFVQMHPLEWNVNRLVLRGYFGLECFFSNPSLLEQHRADSLISIRDLSGLQTHSFRPFLHGNVVPGTTNSWSQYVKNIQFDEATGLAIILVQGQFISTGDVSSLPPEETASALINFVVQENRAQGCLESSTPYDTYVAQHNRTQMIDTQEPNQRCWIPVLMKSGGGFFEPFLKAVLEFENAPAILVNIQGHVEAYGQPQQIGPNDLWVVSYEEDADIMRQLRLTLTDDRKGVTNLAVLEHDLGSIPNATKDDTLRKNIAYLRELADEAQANNPIKGLSSQMPVARVDGFRACFGGECPIGNLFTDALRWYADADFAFIQSGGVRGTGWPEGPVKVSDIWSALPFANSQCTGAISGVTMYKLFELSTREAEFLSERTTNGDRLFQVSGLKYTYNTQLEAPRLVKLEILDRADGQYVPIERLRLYKYATSSWMCTGFHPFPSILSDELVIEGESSLEIGDQLLQNIVGEYLEFAHSTEPYDTSIQGRLTNDTSATEVLDFIQTTESCTSSTYWVESVQSCVECPSAESVIMTGSRVDFQGLSGVDELFIGDADIFNGEEFSITVALKSKPAWVTILGDTSFSDDGRPQPIPIQSGEGFRLQYAVSAKDLNPGVATGALSFAVLDAGNFPGCVGRDLVFELSQNISSTPELFQEGSIRIVGFTMVAIVSGTAFTFALWVYTRREKKAVKMMQPTFLLAICFGVFVIGLSILTRSLHGWHDLSSRGQDMVCMANAWLLSMGISLVMSAVLAKLWRINRVIDGARAFRRTEVTVKSAVMHFSIQFVVNFILMLVWTLVDPMQYEIRVVKGEDWKLYGTCANMGAAGWTFLGLTVGINFVILLLAVHEAYKARHLGEEYSESAGLGLAIFSWLQLFVVVFPVLFLIEEDNVNPRYFLGVSLIFGCCMSMLLFIFVPIMMKVRRCERPQLQSTSAGFGNYRFTSARFLMKSVRSFRHQTHHPSAPPTVMRKENSILVDKNTKRRGTVGDLSTIPQSEAPTSEMPAVSDVDQSTKEVLDLEARSEDDGPSLALERAGPSTKHLDVIEP